MDYVFRIDGAKDNDAFFASICSNVSCAYAGVDFRVGKWGWAPDLLKVEIDDDPGGSSLTIIELEATESAAIVSSRKYLPEDSSGIVAAFIAYLDRVIRQCRSTADPRGAALIHLKSRLAEIGSLRVKAAGALRSAGSFVEEFPLIDQPNSLVGLSSANGDTDQRQEEDVHFGGVLRLSQNQVRLVGRCVMILDAIIRGQDHSGATFRDWRSKSQVQPLKAYLARNGTAYPALHTLVATSPIRGTTVDFENVLAELALTWTEASQKTIDAECIRRLVSAYFPIASAIKTHQRMQTVFDAARVHVSAQLET